MEGEKIKGVSLGTWLALLGMILNIGITYGVMQSSIKIVESKVESFENAIREDRHRQESILQSISEQQRAIDKNTQEIRHLRELQEMQKMVK